eukprot:scaffold42408_cov176-Amphora_coffeaeformis.AAC.2
MSRSPRRLASLFLLHQVVALVGVSAWTQGSPLQESARHRFSATRYQPEYSHGIHAGRKAQYSVLCAVKTTEELLPAVREGIEEKGVTGEWNTCAELLASEVLVAGGESDSDAVIQAEVLLASALDWRAWARVTSTIARKYMKPKLPSSEQLQAAIEWLRNGPLEMTDPVNLVNAIKENPSAYLLDPETSYKKALETAPKQYRDPDTFKALLMEDPSVLECTFNCANEGCNSNCGNCWVTYEVKRGQVR